MIKRDSRIFGNNVTINNDTWVTQLNNNDLIIGGSGAGKTRSYVKPNIERAFNESIVVADTKGNLYKMYKDVLKKRGYRVINIDFKNLVDSEVGFNPFDYIRKDRNGHYRDQDIIKLGRLLCPNEFGTDPFWDNSAQNFLNCAISCVLETQKGDLLNMNTLFEYARSINTEEFGKVIDALRGQETDDHRIYAVKCYSQVEETKGSEKTMSSILSVLENHVAIFECNDVISMFLNDNQLKFESIGEEKTALFITISDSDRAMDPVINLMYTNMFDALIQHADRQQNERLKVPVHFYMDDFATNTRIPDFDNLISVIRSREISVSLIIQDIEQLEKNYPKGAKTIISNCDHILFLGTHDPATAKFIGGHIGMMTTNVMRKPRNKAYLIEAGGNFRTVDKYTDDLSTSATKRTVKRNRFYESVV